MWNNKFQEPQQWPTPEQSRKALYKQPVPTHEHKRIQAFITSEWLSEPKLTTAAAILDVIALSKPLPGNIIQVNEVEATDIQDSYQAFEPTEPLTMFWHGSSSSDNAATSRRVRVQYKGSSQFLPAQLTFHTLGANSPLPKAPKQVNINAGVAKDDRCTIRITAPESYRKAFLSNNNREDTPKNIIADLQRWQMTAATRAQLTGGEWKRNYTAQGPQFQGHLKVRAELAQELLKQSGNRALFITQCGNRQHQPTVKWHKRIQNESHEDYFQRVEAIAQAEAAPIRYRTGGAADL